MEQQPLKRVIKASPRKMLAEFSSMTTLKWVGVALAIHVVVICGTSLGTIRDWCDPEGAKARVAAVKAAEEAAKVQAATPAPTAAPTGATRPGTKPAEDRVGEDRKNSPVVKRLSETATAPKESGRGGIGLEDVLGK